MKSEHLYHPFTNVWMKWRHELSKQDWYDNGMRARLAAIRHAGALVRAGMDSAVAVKTALFAHQNSQYARVDQELWKSILDEQFPGIEVANLEEEMEHKINDANPDAGDYQKLKMDQLWCKTRIRHSCIVLATDTKVVEGVLKTIGGTFSLLDAKKEHDQLINVDLRAALLKAHEVENHWIVMQGPAKHWWAPCLEDFNTLCDDNKKIVFTTGETITLAPTSRIIVVSPDCITMSPATVSRNGIINALKL